MRFVNLLLIDLRQANREDTVLQAGLDILFPDTLNSELTAETVGASFLTQEMTFIILAFLLFFLPGFQRENTVFVGNMNLILGETGHISHNFIMIFLIFDIHFRDCRIIFINRRNIIKEMIKSGITK